MGEWKNLAPAMSIGFPDLEMDITRIVVNGNTAYFERTIKGSFSGEEFMGAVPTGEKFTSKSSFLVGFDEDDRRICDLVTIHDDTVINQVLQNALRAGQEKKQYEQDQQAKAA